MPGLKPSMFISHGRSPFWVRRNVPGCRARETPERRKPGWPCLSLLNPITRTRPTGRSIICGRDSCDSIPFRRRNIRRRQRRCGTESRSFDFKVAQPSASAMSNIHQSGFDTATRIAAGDDGTSYDKVAILLHWATAIIVLIQFATAETWDYFAKPTQEGMQSFHVSMG